jgi:hypothetical protein
MASAPKKLYMLASRRDEVLDDDPTWWEQAGRFQGCRGCARPRAGLYPRPLEAVVQMRQRAPVSLSGNSCVVIFRRDLADRLGPHAPQMVCGECRFSNGVVLKDSVTVHFPRELEVVVRGGRSTRLAYGTCGVCGGPNAAMAMFTKPWYTLRRALPPADVMVSTDQAVVVTDTLAERLDLAHFPDLVLRPILIMDEPIEPIPEFGER